MPYTKKNDYFKSTQFIVLAILAVISLVVIWVELYEQVNFAIVASAIQIQIGVFIGYISYEFEKQNEKSESQQRNEKKINNIQSVTSSLCLNGKLSSIDIKKREEIEPILNKFINNIGTLSQLNSTLFYEFEKRRLEGVAKLLKRTTEDHSFSILSNAERAMEHETFIKIVGQKLPKNAEYLGVSNIYLWTSEVLQSPEGYLDSCIEAAMKKGCKFKRVLLVHDEFINLGEEEQGIIRLHYNRTRNIQNFETKVRLVNKDVMFQQNFAICQLEEEDRHCLIEVIYREKIYQEMKVSISDKMSGEAHRARKNRLKGKFTTNYSNAMGIEQYIRK